MGQWFGLAQTIASYAQTLSQGKLTGIEKACCVTEAIVLTAQSIWVKHTESLSEEEADKLKQGFLRTVCTIIENPDIIKGSTTILKKLLNLIDKNKDGEISKKECHMFWCCGKLPPGEVEELEKKNE